jgi:hypothetical protein
MATGLALSLISLKSSLVLSNKETALCCQERSQQNITLPSSNENMY